MLSNKKTMREVENKIKEFFFIENKIGIILSTIENLENQMTRINEELKTLSFLDTNKIDIKSPSFENIGNNSSPISYIENGIIKQIEQKEKIINTLKEQIENYKYEVEILQLKNVKVKNIFNILNEEYRKMLVLKYSKSKSEIEIADMLNVSISQYHRIKMKILKDIYNLIIMYDI